MSFVCVFSTRLLSAWAAPSLAVRQAIHCATELQNTKLKTLTKPIGTSHEKKKTVLTKTTHPLVLKLLAALCMLDCVGAQYETDRTAQNAQKVRVLLPKHTDVMDAPRWS